MVTQYSSTQAALMMCACVAAIYGQTYAGGYGGTSQCVVPDVGPFAVIAVLSGNSTATGFIRGNQSAVGQPTIFTGQISGLSANTKHGLHVHRLGDLSNGCDSAGVHYNPTNKTHGDINAAVNHVGDMGNVMSDANGVITLSITDSEIQLSGPYSAVGRTVVIHALVDDLGLGGNAASLANGNSGARLACGILGQLKL